MGERLTADDLLPLVKRLPREEQIRLAKLALMAASRDSAGDAGAYRVAPPKPDEFGSDNHALSWDAAGWEKLDAAG